MVRSTVVIEKKILRIGEPFHIGPCGIGVR
jgi:hypothetical protein